MILVFANTQTTVWAMVVAWHQTSMRFARVGFRRGAVSAMAATRLYKQGDLCSVLCSVSLSSAYDSSLLLLVSSVANP